MSHTPAKHALRTGPAAEETLRLPHQSDPAHEAVSPPRPVVVPAHVHWVEHARRRYLAAGALALVIVGSFACLVVTLLTRSPVAAVALGLCMVGFVVLRMGLMSAELSIVDLNGPLLTAERGGRVDSVDLTDPALIIETRGDPADREWRFVAETRTGRTIELGPRQVDAVVLEAAVRHYREVAAGRRPRRHDIRWRG